MTSGKTAFAVFLTGKSLAVSRKRNTNIPARRAGKLTAWRSSAPKSRATKTITTKHRNLLCRDSKLLPFSIEYIEETRCNAPAKIAKRTQGLLTLGPHGKSLRDDLTILEINMLQPLFPLSANFAAGC
jgi:hypothetical protein